MITSIEITFAAPIELPPGFDRVLDALVDMACKEYERTHTDRVMWPAGQGFKPKWVSGDIESFDNSTYVIECCEREDYHGRNEHNPNKKELQAKAEQERKRTRRMPTITPDRSEPII